MANCEGAVKPELQHRGLPVILLRPAFLQLFRKAGDETYQSLANQMANHF